MNLRGDRHRAERGVEMIRTCARLDESSGWWGVEWLERWDMYCLVHGERVW